MYKLDRKLKRCSEHKKYKIRDKVSKGYQFFISKLAEVDRFVFKF